MQTSPKPDAFRTSDEAIVDPAAVALTNRVALWAQAVVIVLAVAWEALAA